MWVSRLSEECQHTHARAGTHKHTLPHKLIQSVICTAATVSPALFARLAVTHTYAQSLAELTRYTVNLSPKRRHLIHQRKINR